MIIMQHFILCWTHTQMFNVIMTHRKYSNEGFNISPFRMEQVNIPFFFLASQLIGTKGIALDTSPTYYAGYQLIGGY